jgi:hypothetical protein
MDHYVTHAAHSRPRKLRVSINELRGQIVNLVHCLTDNLDIAYNRILDLLVLLESFEILQGLKVAGRSFDGLRNVL